MSNRRRTYLNYLFENMTYLGYFNSRFNYTNFNKYKEKNNWYVDFEYSIPMDGINLSSFNSIMVLSQHHSMTHWFPDTSVNVPDMTLESGSSITSTTVIRRDDDCHYEIPTTSYFVGRNSQHAGNGLSYKCNIKFTDNQLILYRNRIYLVNSDFYNELDSIFIYYSVYLIGINE
jgi:hypothetical protein